jgi:hypothetical protein
MPLEIIKNLIVLLPAIIKGMFLIAKKDFFISAVTIIECIGDF